MIRLLFWCGIAWLIYLGIRALGRPGDPARRRPDPAGAEDMVRCVTCGLNVPKSEALAVNGGWACCAGHARRPDAGA